MTVFVYIPRENIRVTFNWGHIVQDPGLPEHMMPVCLFLLSTAERSQKGPTFLNEPIVHEGQVLALPCLHRRSRKSLGHFGIRGVYICCPRDKPQRSWEV